jgi:hypothetical protein
VEVVKAVKVAQAQEAEEDAAEAEAEEERKRGAARWGGGSQKKQSRSWWQEGRDAEKFDGARRQAVVATEEARHGDSDQGGQREVQTTRGTKMEINIE